MPAFLAAVLGKALPYLLAGAVVMGGWFYIQHLRSQLTDLSNAKAALSQQLDQAQAVNQANLDALARYKAEAEKAIAALADERDEAIRQQAELRTLAGRIAAQARAPGRDAPVAPVLLDALAGLRPTDRPKLNAGSMP